MSKHLVYPKKELKISDYKAWGLPTLIAAREWVNRIQHLALTCPVVVRKFYANIGKSINDPDHPMFSK
ncbi:hypothetical protein PanWU01x14_251020, partial [Parasponia andersonii]